MYSDPVYSQSARNVCILCILCILCIQIPGVYAALFEKVVACVCVCECELDATGVALSQIDKRSPCGTIRCQASDWSRKCVLTGEMCLSTEMRADGRDVSLHNTRWQCLKASSKEEQVGVTRCAKENEIN